jgi:crotonobetainyl-CoA:carnitine CoA-transferase CaiB-like acyl-CoA transferase
MLLNVNNIDTDSPAGPLAGLTVVSLAEQYPGPYASMLMCELGASVILVERPQGGDPARQFPGFFAAMGRGKRSLAIDLKSEEGRAALHALARRADIVLEGFRPGTAKRLGCDHETLRALNPRLVYVSISGFGQTGPAILQPAHDLSFRAMAAMLPQAAQRPSHVHSELPLGDLSAALFATIGALGAIVRRARTGQGCFIDVAIADCLLSLQAAELAPELNGEPPANVFDEPAYAVFAASDGSKLALSIAHEDHFWRRLCDLLDMQQARSLGHDERVRRRTELQARISERIASKPRSEWANLFDRHGIPWGAVHARSDLPADAHIAARGVIFEGRGQDGEAAGWCVSQPLVFDGLRPRATSASPELGEANAAFAAGELR